MKFLLFLTVFYTSFLYSQENRIDEIDIIHYDLGISINDSSDYIFGTECIEINFKSRCDSFYLDLASLNDKERGMIVSEIINLSQPDLKVKFNHINDKLWIFPASIKKDDTARFSIEYAGIPIDGLVIGQNKYKKRTFFGDNWPNRAHNWFACVDHPSDKATVNFTITAPKHYNVIATGLNTANTNEGRMHVFKSDILLPTKVMVFGAADFQIEEMPVSTSFPISSWIYKDENKHSFQDLSPSKAIIEFYTSVIGEYPFGKLANVQSTTRYGGMENAGNIFYDENAFSGEGKMEALIAHEIAHQWFGNSASEKDWEHLWLSEGFATYFTDLYWEKTYGKLAMNKRLSNERARVIQFSKQYNHAVIDTNYANLLQLLNPNSYQKGAWVLHMLRNEVGENDFWKIIRMYYEEYKYSNASSIDFIHVVNSVTGRDYSAFFNQWLKRSGQPKVKASIEQKRNEISIELTQIQASAIYVFPLDILFVYNDGTQETVKYLMNDKTLSASLKTKKKLKTFVLDPKVRLLFEEE